MEQASNDGLIHEHVVTLHRRFARDPDGHCAHDGVVKWCFLNDVCCYFAENVDECIRKDAPPYKITSDEERVCRIMCKYYVSDNSASLYHYYDMVDIIEDERK